MFWKVFLRVIDAVVDVLKSIFTDDDIPKLSA